tara:strand:- start:2814 stop:2981 length:168 start_codon:yes stop_codon:yes gene_type:complete
MSTCGGSPEDPFGPFCAAIVVGISNKPSVAQTADVLIIQVILIVIVLVRAINPAF